MKSIIWAYFGVTLACFAPGPNSFWVRTCLRYAAYTGDEVWPRRYIPTMRKGLGYLRGMVRAFTMKTSFCQYKIIVLSTYKRIVLLRIGLSQGRGTPQHGSRICIEMIILQ